MSLARAFSVVVSATACALAYGLCGIGTARADEEATPDQIKYAAEEFNAGAKAFRTGNFAEAAEHYENSFREVPTKPSVLRAAIQNRVKAKQKARAATLSALALAKFPGDAATVALAKEVLSASEKSLARVNIACSEPCALFIDSATSPYKPTKQAVVYVDPGEHAIAASWGEKRNESKKIDGKPGGVTDLSFRPPSLPASTITVPSAEKPREEVPVPPPVASETAAKPLPRWVFFAAAGVTGAVAGVTVWSAVDMRGNPGKAKVEADCLDLGSACPTYKDALSSQTRTNVLLGVSAGALVATGVIGVFFTDFRKTPAAASAPLGPTFTPVVGARPEAGGGLSVGAYGTF